MATENAALDKIMFVSDFNPAHYNWTPQELKALGDVRLMAEVIVARFKAHNITIDSFYAIKHDGDTKNMFWLPSKRNDKEPKFKEYQKEIRAHEHTHQLLFFNKDTKVDRYKSAEIMGVSPLTIDKIHSKDGCLAYLCHSKYEKKFQYPKTAVQTIAGEDFSSIYDRNYERWYAARYSVKEYTMKKANKALFQDAKRRFIDGEITYEEIFAIDEYHSMISETYYYNQLKKLKSIQDDKDRINLNTLIRKIQSDKLIKINIEELNNAFKRAYIDYQSNIHSELFSNLQKKIIDNEISVDEIASDEYILSLFVSKADDYIVTILTRRLEKLIKSNAISISEIIENPVYSYLYDYNHSIELDPWTEKKEKPKVAIDKSFYNQLIERIENNTIDFNEFTEDSYLYYLYQEKYKMKYEYERIDEISSLVQDFLVAEIESKNITSINQIEQNLLFSDVYELYISMPDFYNNQLIKYKELLNN